MSTIWDSYDAQSRELYIKSIQALGALSPMFRQKSEESEDRTAFISSKYQETVFARFFNGKVVDRGNDPYDVMVPSPCEGKRDLVGIKTFLNSSSSMQKVMQFKKVANNEGWSQWIADKEYGRLIKRIATLRNQKLRSTQNLLAGAGHTPESAFENVFYHYLSPAKDGYVHVGEADYPFMDEGRLSYTEPDASNRVTAIFFTDGVHEFKYTPADSTLYMRFNHREKYPDGDIVDEFEVCHFEDPHAALMRMLENEFGANLPPVNEGLPANVDFGVALETIEEEPEEYVVFPLFRLDKRGDTEAGEVDKKSGLNVRLANPKNKGSNLPRPVNEVEIRIPEAREFHETYPFFFGATATGEPKSKLHRAGKEWKADFNIDQRTFKLTLTQSGVQMEALITGSSNKQIMSKDSQEILGSWILSQVFQLAPYERLTRDKLDELGLDGIKLIRLDEGHIGMEFIKVSDKDLRHLWPKEPEKFQELALIEESEEE